MFKELNVYVGCMYAGKSTKMMNLYEKCEGPKLYVKFTLKLLDEPSYETITTHDNKCIGGYRANSLAQIIPLAKEKDYLFLDEIHFIDDWDKWPELVRDKKLYVSALDMDFNGRPYESVGTLLCCASHIEKLHGWCIEGNPTEFSWRITKDQDRNVEDTGDNYIPLCRECFMKK